MAMRAAKLGSVALLTVALTGIASAADQRVPMRPRAYVPVSSWTGCYLGGYVGGAWKESDPNFTDLGNALFGAYSGGITAPGVTVEPAATRERLPTTAPSRTIAPLPTRACSPIVQSCTRHW